MSSNLPAETRLGMTEHELLRQIEGDAWTLDQLRNEYLELAGWKRTSSFPDCIWRWTKEVGGVVLALSQSDALSIQQTINPPPEDDEYE